MKSLLMALRYGAKGWGSLYKGSLLLVGIRIV